MRSFIFAAVSAAALVAAQLRIETPTNLAVCQPALLSWGGGTAPYYPAVIPGGQPSAAALKDFGSQSGTSLTWNVDIKDGTEISLRITDSTGAVNYSEKVTIRTGSSTSCLNGNSASSGASSGASAAASSGASAAAGVSSTAAGAASSAAAGVQSAASGASSKAANAASSAAGAVQSGASSISGAAAGSAASAARSGSTSSGAAYLSAQIKLGGVLGAVAGVFGVAML